MKLSRPKKCECCKKKLGKKDFYGLCRKCQPIWVKGYKTGKQVMINIFEGFIEDCKIEITY